MTDSTEPRMAAMMSNEELIEAMLIAERYATIAFMRLDADGKNTAYTDRDAYLAELHNRLAAISSGSVGAMAASDVYDDVRRWMMDCLSYLDEVITLDCVVDTLLSDLTIGGFEVIRAAEAGRVVITRDVQHQIEIALVSLRNTIDRDAQRGRWESINNLINELVASSAARQPESPS